MQQITGCQSQIVSCYNYKEDTAAFSGRAGRLGLLDVMHGYAASNPGELAPTLYVNILVYNLAENHYPAGPVPLDTATNAFRDIPIAPPVD
jgi:hypothetical protein